MTCPSISTKDDFFFSWWLLDLLLYFEELVLLHDTGPANVKKKMKVYFLPVQEPQVAAAASVARKTLLHIDRTETC